MLAYLRERQPLVPDPWRVCHRDRRVEPRYVNPKL
jgi:hypothetical protein